MQLEEEIRARASYDGRFVRVHTWLNHRVDPGMLERIGAAIDERSHDLDYDVILTPEASGIPVAMAVSSATGIPFIYAKKYANAPEGMLSRAVSSPTKGAVSWLAVDPTILVAGSAALIVDDFLAGGSSSVALTQMAQEAGCRVTAVFVVIDKAFAGGADRLADLGVPTRSLVRFGSVDELPTAKALT